MNDIVHCEFQNEIITAIDIIYDNGKSMLETSRKRIRHVIGTLKKKNNFVVKVMKPSFLTEIAETIKQQFNETTHIYPNYQMKCIGDRDFLKEITAERRVKEIYTAAGKQNLLAYTPFYVRGRAVSGLRFQSRSGTSFFLCGFSSLCVNKNYTIDHRKFAQDIIESLIVLNDHGEWFHGDIKMSNIVLCNGKYKLIDWGAAGPLYNRDNRFYEPSKIIKDPLIAYISGYPKPIIDIACASTTAKPVAYLHKSFEEIYLKENGDRSALLLNYGHTSDIIAFGLLLSGLHPIFTSKSFLRLFFSYTSFSSTSDALKSLQKNILFTRKSKKNSTWKIGR